MEAFTLENEEICDWCGTAQVVKQSFDLRRMLCVDQDACLTRVPISAKNHSMGGKDIITFPCVVPHCEGKSIRQGNYCTKHASYTDAGLKAVHAPHGSVRRYKGTGRDSGCSCIECKRANAEYKILIKQLSNFVVNEDETVVVDDLHNWIRHILDILYSGAPDKKVVKVLGEDMKVKYEITTIENTALSDELSQKESGLLDTEGRPGGL